jgi:hypothetical protein
MSRAAQRLDIPVAANGRARVARKAAMTDKASVAEIVPGPALNYEPAGEEAAAGLRGLVAQLEKPHAATTGRTGSQDRQDRQDKQDKRDKRDKRDKMRARSRQASGHTRRHRGAHSDVHSDNEPPAHGGAS